MRSSSIQNSERGSVVVESALALPPLLLFLLGIVLLGQIFVRHILVSRAVSIASRQASIQSANYERVSQESFAGYLAQFGMGNGASLSVEVIDEGERRGLAITGVSGDFCPLCQRYLGIGAVSAQRYIQLE